MSNRKKAKKPWLGIRGMSGRLPAQEVLIPSGEKEVIKTVPAKIADEVVGTAILYSDGTTDVIINDVISEEARLKMGDVVKAFNAETGAHFSVETVDKKLTINEE